jgi:hypothetical protein
VLPEFGYGLGVEAEHPLVREVFPELATELVALLEQNGEHELAISAHDLRLVAGCGCGDDFCQSFYTEPRPHGPYGPGHRCIPLLPANGMLNLDVVNGRIMHVEVLDRPPLRNGRPDEPENP